MVSPWTQCKGRWTSEIKNQVIFSKLSNYLFKLNNSVLFYANFVCICKPAVLDIFLYLFKTQIFQPNDLYKSISLKIYQTFLNNLNISFNLRPNENFKQATPQTLKPIDKDQVLIQKCNLIVLIYFCFLLLA